MKHKFADSDITGFVIIEDEFYIDTNPCDEYFFTKEDIIAMAKLVGITGEDLG